MNSKSVSPVAVAVLDVLTFAFKLILFLIVADVLLSRVAAHWPCL